MFNGRASSYFPQELEPYHFLWNSILLLLPPRSWDSLAPGLGCLSSLRTLLLDGCTRLHSLTPELLHPGNRLFPPPSPRSPASATHSSNPSTPRGSLSSPRTTTNLIPNPTGTATAALNAQTGAASAVLGFAPLSWPAAGLPPLRELKLSGCQRLHAGSLSLLTAELSGTLRNLDIKGVSATYGQLCGLLTPLTALTALRVTLSTDAASCAVAKMPRLQHCALGGGIGLSLAALAPLEVRIRVQS